MLQVNDIERYCGVTAETVRHLAQRKAAYKRYCIRKPSGGRRMVYEPHAELKALQRRLLQLLQDVMQPHPCATAMTGALDNARRHARAVNMLRLDAVDFFGSFRPQRVRRTLRRAMDPDAAQLVTIATTSGGELRQGAPTSAYLADLCCWDLDDELDSNIAAVYTRYVDDIALSVAQDVTLPKLEDLRLVFSRHGLRINAKKVAYTTPKSDVAPVLTGFVVEALEGRPAVRAPRVLWRRLRSNMHQLERDGDLALYEKTRGLLSFLQMSDPDKAAPFARRLAATKETCK